MGASMKKSVFVCVCMYMGEEGVSHVMGLVPEILERLFSPVL